MPQEESTNADAHPDEGVLAQAELSQFAEFARQAYERKETKKYEELTPSTLVIDNSDAQQMRSSIQSKIQKELQSTRAFSSQVQTNHSLELQSQTTHAAVSAEAKVDSGDANAEPPPATEAAPAAPFVPFSSALVHSRRTLDARWLVAAAVVAVVFGSVVLDLPRFRAASNPVEATRKPAAPAASSPLSTNPASPSDLFTPVGPEVSAPPAGRRSAPVVVPPVAAAARRPAAKVPDPSVIAGSGALAVSSPTTVDIYKDGAYLGSVPVTLELPAGTHTLEYRNGTLSRNVSHVIRANQVTKATISFDVSLRINSRPWAEVFIDGVERRSLGQTPLSGVRVPIGTVLIFENREFQPKKYRVTGNESGIQNVFP